MSCTCTTLGHCVPCEVFRRREHSRSGPASATAGAASSPVSPAHESVGVVAGPAPFLPPRYQDFDKGVLDLLSGGCASGWEESFDDVEVDCA